MCALSSLQMVAVSVMVLGPCAPLYLRTWYSLEEACSQEFFRCAGPARSPWPYLHTAAEPCIAVVRGAAGALWGRRARTPLLCLLSAGLLRSLGIGCRRSVGTPEACCRGGPFGRRGRSRALRPFVRGPLRTALRPFGSRLRRRHASTLRLKRAAPRRATAQRRAQQENQTPAFRRMRSWVRRCMHAVVTGDA